MSTLLPCGDDALLMDCVDLAEAQGWHAALRHDERVVEAVLGARTVLLRGVPGQIRAAVDESSPAEVSPVDAREHVLSVVYDGEDLDQVAELTGLSRADVVVAHTGTAWMVAFGGFAPGFAYLTGGDPRLEVPRLETPRAQVPAGSVGLAGEFSGVYPRASPGGWQLIGRCDVTLFDPDREPAALLSPGDTVRFEEAD